MFPISKKSKHGKILNKLILIPLALGFKQKPPLEICKLYKFVNENSNIGWSLILFPISAFHAHGFLKFVLKSQFERNDGLNGKLVGGEKLFYRLPFFFFFFPLFSRKIKRKITELALFHLREFLGTYPKGGKIFKMEKFYISARLRCFN